jgi:hypothetical protein
VQFSYLEADFSVGFFVPVTAANDREKARATMSSYA